MYDYNRRRKIGPVTILLLFLFSASIVGLSIISYLDRGRFWDILPYFCIPIIVLSLVFAIYNLVRRCNAGFVFILFFIVFTIGLVLSSVFGPFALRREAVALVEQKDYPASIEKFESILENYPNSRYAEEALQRISSAYYYNNQFPQALRSFEEAIDKGVIAPDGLEVMDILQDTYYRIAREQESGKEYLDAANNYLESIKILKKIISDFPDTNEAFIAQYKIPQYLYESAKAYDKYGDILSRIKSLEEIIEAYPESDYYQDALEALDEAYIDRAIELISESDYENAIQWFLRFFAKNPGPWGSSMLGYKIDSIFSVAPPSVIKSYADTAYRDKDYIAAVFLYEMLISYNPGYQESILDNLVGSKIFLAQSAPYNEIFGSATGKYINLPELCLLVFTNNTGNILTAYIKGPSSYMVIIPVGETVETEIIPGEYIVLLEPRDPASRPYMGTILFEEFRKYSQTIKEVEDEAS